MNLNPFMAEKNFENFLQSDKWREFQAAVGHRTFCVASEKFSASIIEHQLPIVGKYFYLPRGPITKIDFSIALGMTNLLSLAKNEGAGWIRIEPENEELLASIEKNIQYKIVKAPQDVQPKEIFVIDIARPAEQLLAEMKSKTRYNLNLAQKHTVVVKQQSLGIEDKKYVAEFLRLIRLTEKRKQIKFHADKYYQKMLEILPEGMRRLYVAEYEHKIIAANLVIFFEDTAIYLHGATDDEYRNQMAPYLLQWQAILDAQKAGCKFYDLGGVKTESENNSQAGITKFKLGFSPKTKPIEFPGSYDIIISPAKYWLYRGLQKLKKMVRKYV
jgi:peptidoglycan pentaglycine glycine transferase (the first glycine)